MADQKISALSAAGALGGTEAVPIVQAGSTVKTTVAAIAALATGTGTVTSVSVTTANGVSGSVATATTTPAISLTLGAITPTTVNGNTITTGTGTLTLGAGSTLATSATNSITLTSTAATNVTLPTTGTLMANPMTTGGDVIYGGASGVPTRLANGSANQVLQSNGTTLAPTWVTLAGGGNALTSNPLSQFAATTSAQFAGVISDETGTGLVVLNNGPTFIAPVLGTPASGVGTNLTGTAAGLTSGITQALKSATTTVDVSAATAPTSGQVLTATAGTTATWQTPGGGSGTVTHTAGALTANAIVLGNAAADITVMGSLGTTTTVLHGNAAGAPTFGAVNLATDVTGSLPASINAQTGTTYTVVSGDQGKLVTLSNGSAIAVTLPQATGSFTTGWSVALVNLGAGLVTITPTTSTINGAATVVLATGQSLNIASDGTNYQGTFGGRTANALRSATTIVDTSAATAPTSGQVLTATAGTTATWQTPAAGGTGAVGVPCGRLTLTTGVPVTTADVTGATTIYYTPYCGNNIPLWNGSAWAATTFTQVSLALGTLTSGLPYDVFGFLNTGALNTELLAWTNDSTRATAITLQDGMYCKSGDHTRLYLGTFYTTSTTATEDSKGGTTTQIGAKRYVWNMYNRRSRPMAVFDSTDNWSYTTGTIRQANAAAGNKMSFILGLAEDTVSASLTSCVNLTANSARGAQSLIGLDTTSAATAGAVQTQGYILSASAAQVALGGSYEGFPAAGKHDLNWNESGADITCLFIGDGGTAITQSGMTGRVMA